jgi:hypothetical protein
MNEILQGPGLPEKPIDPNAIRCLGCNTVVTKWTVCDNCWDEFPKSSKKQLNPSPMNRIFTPNQDKTLLVEKATKTMKVLMSSQDKKGIVNCPQYVPMSMLNELWASRIHGQTLDRLNERGGMGVSELLCNIDKGPMPTREGNQTEVDRLNSLVAAHLLTLQPLFPLTEGKMEYEEGKDFNIRYEVLAGLNWQLITKGEYDSLTDKHRSRLFAVAIPVDEKIIAAVVQAQIGTNEQHDAIQGHMKEYFTRWPSYKKKFNDLEWYHIFLDFYESLATPPHPTVEATENEQAFIRRVLDLYRKTRGNVTVTPSTPTVEEVNGESDWLPLSPDLKGCILDRLIIELCGHKLFEHPAWGKVDEVCQRLYGYSFREFSDKVGSTQPGTFWSDIFIPAMQQYKEESTPVNSEVEASEAANDQHVVNVIEQAQKALTPFATLFGELSENRLRQGGILWEYNKQKLHVADFLYAAVIADKLKALLAFLAGSRVRGEGDAVELYLLVDNNSCNVLSPDKLAVWEKDGSCESGDKLYKAVLIKTY